MKKLNGNKKGFTLIEIILVVAIITIIAGVAVFNIGSSINAYKQRAEELRVRQEQYGTLFEPGASYEAAHVLRFRDYIQMARRDTLRSYPIPDNAEQLPTSEAYANPEMRSWYSSYSSIRDDDSRSIISYTVGGDIVYRDEDTGETITETFTFGEGENVSNRASDGREVTVVVETSAAAPVVTEADPDPEPITDPDPEPITNPDPVPENNTSGGNTNFSSVTHGEYWNGSANVPNTTASGSVRFDQPVSSFTISVSGDVTDGHCYGRDWRYSITDNGNGTYTFTYTANQYRDNPPISEIGGLSFTVDGNTAPTITVVSYTPYTG